MERSSAIRILGCGAGVLVTAGLVYVAAVQHQTISRLRAEQRTQPADLKELERLRAELNATRGLRNQQTEIEQLREDNKDLLRLRNEVRQLREQAGETEALRAANTRFLQIIQDKGALPSNQMASVAAIRKQGAVLGVHVLPTNDPQLTAAVAQRYKGVLVVGIMPDAPAAQTDLKSGDIIIRLDGHVVESAAELQTEMLTKKPGEIVVLDIMRGDTMLRIPVPARAWPE